MQSKQKLLLDWCSL